MIQKMIIGGTNAHVDGYPTIRLLQGGKKKKDYNGKREVKDLAKFIKKSLGKCRKESKKKTKRKKKKRKRSRKSWHIRFGEDYNLSRERIGLGMRKKQGGAREEKETENAKVEKSSRNGQVRVESEL